MKAALALALAGVAALSGCSEAKKALAAPATVTVWKTPPTKVVRGPTPPQKTVTITQVKPIPDDCQDLVDQALALADSPKWGEMSSNKGEMVAAADRLPGAYYSKDWRRVIENNNIIKGHNQDFATAFSVLAQDREDLKQAARRCKEERADAAK